LNDKRRPSVVVIGVGNRALSDEGVGSRVVREVRKKVPPGVEVVDAGLPGPGLIDLLEEREKAVIVDAIDAGGLSGTLYRFGLDDVASARPDRSCSLHQGDVLQYVRLAEALGTGPKEVVFVGIQPESFSPGENLSPTVEAAIAGAAGRVLAETAREGASRARDGQGP
jgi:hydrogenase maturation protease